MSIFPESPMGDYIPLTPEVFHEEVRLDALRRCRIMDTPSDPVFRRLVVWAKETLDTPFCAISLVDGSRQWFKESVGVPFCESPREHSFCQFVVQDQNLINISNALMDDRAKVLVLVTDEPHLRSYLGVPIRTHDGFVLGSFCVFDTKIRNFGAAEVKIMEALAAVVSAELQLRETALQLTGDVNLALP